ncbi:hypothetical protein CY35_14G010200 [Sphagnum magellanicum]|nr:hypothetical protein CY35_14G010200 [Sphagnum magellanicum]
MWDIKSRCLPWRLSIIFVTFWAILNFIGTFFTTLFSLEEKGPLALVIGLVGGPSGGSGRGPYGGNGGGAPHGLDNVQGIDHSAVPPCDSCCAG